MTRTPSGRAHKLRLAGDTNLLIAAAALRLAVARSWNGDQVRSDLFAVRVEGGHYIFNGVGSGHGVGLCQAGAAEMGIEGKSYDEILSFYYPGTTLQARRPAVVSGNRTPRSSVLFAIPYNGLASSMKEERFHE